MYNYHIWQDIHGGKVNKLVNCLQYPDKGQEQQGQLYVLYSLFSTQAPIIGSAATKCGENNTQRASFMGVITLTHTHSDAAS